MIIKFVIIAALSWLIGVFGWSQVIGSLQNIRVRRSLLFTLILWMCILGVVAYVAIVRFDGTWALLVGYLVSLFQVLCSGKIH